MIGGGNLEVLRNLSKEFPALRIIKPPNASDNFNIAVVLGGASDIPKGLIYSYQHTRRQKPQFRRKKI